MAKLREYFGLHLVLENKGQLVLTASAICSALEAILLVSCTVVGLLVTNHHCAPIIILLIVA